MVGSPVTTTMDMTAVMDALATASGIRNAYGWPKDDAVPPCVIVGYPTEWDFDVTFGVGNARAVYPLWYVIGKVVEHTTVAKVSAAVLALKAALEAASLVIRVREATFEPVIMAGATYMSVRLDCEVYS